MPATWRDRYRVTVAGDVGTRAAAGWDFTTSDGTLVWTVCRHDDVAFPVFSSARGEAPLPARDELLDMTGVAVRELLAAAGLADDVGWITQNLATALSWAGEDVIRWEGTEWALVESGPEAPVWASPSQGRTPFAWLRALLADGSLQVDVYQDDAVFGLDFTGRFPRELPGEDVDSFRSRRGIPLARGPVRSVDVVYDTTVDGRHAAGLVTEVLLRARTEAVLLIAAEAYGRDEWHLYDESVVAIPQPQRADTMSWIPARQAWPVPGTKTRPS